MSSKPAPEDPESPASISPAAIPRRGRLLGVDYGTKRVGFAVSNPDQTISSPLENYTRRDKAQDARHLRQITDEYRMVGAIIGLPVHMSGDEGGKAREAREFGTWVHSVTGLPVGYWDERYTSSLAEEHLLGAALSKKKRQARLDMLAAQIMLQSYLDGARGDAPPGAW